MLAPPEGLGAEELSVRPLRGGCSEYLELYERVGGEYRWTRRLEMSETQLAQWLGSEGVEVWVLEVDGQAAGFTELDRRSDDVEIVYFGLAPEFIGRGLGKRFLQWVIGHAWAGDCRRLWLHTCTRDHAAALPNYRRAGFELYDQRPED